MGNQASCCTQNKEAIPSEFRFGTPTSTSKVQIPGMSTLPDNSTGPTSALRKQSYTDCSVIKTQQDLSDNVRILDAKKKKKLVRKKPPPLTDLGSLQDCMQIDQGPVFYEAAEQQDIENEQANECHEITDRRKAMQCWENTEEDRNLSVRLSEKRCILKERAVNVTYREEDLTDLLQKEGARGIQSRKEIIEAGIVAQKYGEDEDDIDMQYEDESNLKVDGQEQQKNHSIKNQHISHQRVMSNNDKHYKSTQNDALTEVFETPREEFEEITDRITLAYGIERDFSVPQNVAIESKRQMGSKTNRSSQENGICNAQIGYGGQGKITTDKRIQNTQEDEIHKTVSTVYEDAVSCSMYYGRREQVSQIADTLGNESARSARKQASKNKETPVSARRQMEYQDTNKSTVKEESYSPHRINGRNRQETEEMNSARDKSRDDAAKLLSGLYHTCQSVVPAEPMEMSPMREKPDGEREGQMRRSFCGEDRKLFVSEIIKNIQMKNAYNKDRGTPQKRENLWLVKADREKDSSNPEAQRRESVQRDVQKLMESAFKPRNSLIENILRQSKEGNIGQEKIAARREKDGWREELERKSEYSHPFWADDHGAREISRESPQQEQREDYKKSVLDTPGFKNENMLNKSWENYSVQERKDMLLTKRFMDVPISGYENK